MARRLASSLEPACNGLAIGQRGIHGCRAFRRHSRKRLCVTRCPDVPSGHDAACPPLGHWGWPLELGSQALVQLEARRHAC